MRVTNDFKIFAFILILAFFSTGDAKAQPVGQFTITPGILYLDLSKTKPTDNFTVRNVGEENIRISVTSVYYPIQSANLNAGIALASFEENSDNISDLVMVSPKIMTLKPNQKRRVRIAIRKKRKFTDGDYRTHLLVATVDKRKTEFKDTPKDSTTSVGLALAMKIQIAIAVYARMGKPDTSLTWECQVDSKGKVNLSVINPSKWRYQGWFGFFPEGEGKDPFMVQLVVSLRESKKNISILKPVDQSFGIRWGDKKEALNSDQTNCLFPSN